jgi:hypothetical protein
VVPAGSGQSPVWFWLCQVMQIRKSVFILLVGLNLRFDGRTMYRARQRRLSILALGRAACQFRLEIGRPYSPYSCPSRQTFRLPADLENFLGPGGAGVSSMGRPRIRGAGTACPARDQLGIRGCDPAYVIVHHFVSILHRASQCRPRKSGRLARGLASLRRLACPCGRSGRQGCVAGRAGTVARLSSWWQAAHSNVKSHLIYPCFKAMFRNA